MAIDIIERELNRLYATDLGKYKEECDDWKSKGYKIYRDTKGRHKVVEPIKKQAMDKIYNATGSDFGDIFNGIFNCQSK